MTRVNVGCDWRPSKVSFEQLAEQVVVFARELQQVNPIFAEIALTGSQYGLDGKENWLRQPLVWDVSQVEWDSLFREDPAVNLYCWNRRDLGDGGCKYVIHANDDVLGNGVTMSNTPPELHTPDALIELMAALIKTFGADQADVYTAWDMDPIWARHWRVWVREGRSLPDAPENRFKKEQGPYSCAEPWLGGTLYTWPEYEPWRYQGPAQS